MWKYIKDNKEVISTALCLIFIIIGLILEGAQQPTLAAASFITGFVIGGWQSALEGFNELVFDKHLSVDVLMVLAAIGAGLIGYWLEGALLIFIFSLSGTLEHLTMQKSRNTIEQLLSVTPDTVRILERDQWIEHPVADVHVGTTIQIRKGEVVPLDGTLISEAAYLNEASMTGESFPIHKNINDSIISGTLNAGNVFEMTVTKDLENSYFNKIVKMVEEAQTRQSKTDKFVTRIEDTYVKIVLAAVPLFILLTPLVLGWDWQEAFYRGMVLLTVASPCALVASASPANLSAISRAAKKGILVKGGDTFDAISKLNTIVFDKTGTVTVGKPTVIDSQYNTGIDQEEVKSIVLTAESNSTHPIATALIEHLKDIQKVDIQLEDVTGKGFIIHHAGNDWKIGKYDFAMENISLEEAIQAKVTEGQSYGQTVIFVSKNNEFAAYYALMDPIKESVKTMITELNQVGVKTVMLTGDQKATADHVAKEIGISEVIANALPEDKLKYIEKCKQAGQIVAMTGDGINDAPALAFADIGIAMGEGTDVAIETADVVVIKDDLRLVPFLIGLTLKMDRIVKFNLFFSIAVIICLILANVFQAINLPLGVVGHEGSTILVILNGLRLLGFKFDEHVK